MQNKTTIEIEKPIVPKWFDEWYKTFNNNGGNNAQALYYLNRTGWGQPLIDGNECEVKGYYEKLHTLFDFGYEYAKEYLSKAIIVGYEVEQEPLYYARVKGWELIVDERDIAHWMIDKQKNGLFVGELPFSSIDLTGDYGYVTKLTADQWNELGIYDDVNAVFIPKEEE